MEDEKAIVATVAGTVQGVGFRFTTVRVARGLDLTGWVMNQPDGTVRTWAQGPVEAVDRFVGFLEEGPPGSRVTRIDVSEKVPDQTMIGFEVRY